MSKKKEALEKAQELIELLAQYDLVEDDEIRAEAFEHKCNVAAVKTFLEDNLL